MGRKSQAHEWVEGDNLILVEGWARDGLSDVQIAHNMGIGITTLKDWKKKYPSFASAIKKKKEVVDREVENALHKRAIGFEYEETKRIQVKKADGTKETRIEKTTKLVLPDVTAQIFWLKNRKPNEWRDKREQVVSTIEDLTPLADLINADDIKEN